LTIAASGALKESSRKFFTGADQKYTTKDVDAAYKAAPPGFSEHEMKAAGAYGVYGKYSSLEAR